MLKSLSLLTRSPLPSSSPATTTTARKLCIRKMSATTTPSPICPAFVPVEEGSGGYSSGNPDGIRFRLVSYNILAQVYVKSSLFPHSPSPSLKWKTRSQAIITVLKNLGADFLCLQELDEYESFYKPNIESHGYSSIYIQRSGQKRDGCGIFFKQNCAELILEERIEYNDLVNSLQDKSSSSHDEDNDARLDSKKSDQPKEGSKETPSDRGDPNDPRVRLKRDCVGIIGAFKLNDPFDHIVVVANTHLYWDPEWADVKLAQAKYLLSRLAKFKTLVSDKYGCTPSVILAGDFNSIPGDKVYQFLVSSSNAASASAECMDEVAPIPLHSYYAHTRGEPLFTNCTPDFTNTLDYILFSPSDQLKPVGILELPETDSPDVAGCLPNYYHPSDHLPIGAEFEITRQ